MYRSNGSERLLRQQVLAPEIRSGFLHADAFDFRLTVVSRLIGIGMNLPEVCFNGVSRPQNKPYDIAAIQYR
jgi:hypothetical protein